MSHKILCAKPGTLAIVGACPFAVAIGSQAFAVGPAALFPAAVYLGVVMLLGWCWIVGNALNAQLDPTARPPAARFHLSVLYCAAYCGYFVLTVTGLVPLPLAQTPGLFFALHLAAMVAMIEILRFVGRNLALAEGDLDGAADSSWTTTFSLFSIGGVLPVQRRVNRIFDGS